MMETRGELENQCNSKIKVKQKNTLEDAVSNSGSSIVLYDNRETNMQRNNECQSLNYVTLESNGLTCLPVTFFNNMSHVVELDLSNNKLSDLPSTLSALKNLQLLNISCNEFCIIPNAVVELIGLKSLIAKRNLLEEIPSDIGNMVNLTNLDLSYNNLMEMPSSCSELKKVQHLSLVGNKFKKIPSCVSNGMPRLSVFHFSENQKAKLNIAPYSIKLSAFYAEKNGLCPSFPSWILSSKYYDLETVVLNGTKFVEIELPTAQHQSRLKKISIRESNLSTEIGENIVSKAPLLESIDFGNVRTLKNQNCFWSLPIPESKHLLNIVEINMSFAGIPFLPKTIGNFTNLTRMDVSGNNIYWLPNEICQLKNLECLIVDNNGLLNLPDDLGSIKKLIEIKANSNKILALPESIKDLRALQYLDLYDNELNVFPKVLLELKLLGLDLERNYFSTNVLPIHRVHYENLLTCLRAHWPQTCKNKDAPKEQVLVSDEIRSPERSCSFSSDDPDSFLLDDTNTVTSIEYERWDISEDSADEFDPHECEEPRNRCISPLVYCEYQKNVFCPGDTHEKSVKTQVIEMLQSGTLVWPGEHEEGDFDDA